MWRTDTPWLDVAIVMGIFAVGDILSDRFEEHRPRGRRLLEPALTRVLPLTLSATVGRAPAYGVLALPLLLAVWVHLVGPRATASSDGRPTSNAVPTFEA